MSKTKQSQNSKPKKILVFNWNNVLTDVIEELNKEFDVEIQFGGIDGVDWKEYDIFVVWNEVGAWSQFVQMVQKAGKRVVLVQHGRRGTSRIYPPFNEKLNADVVCVWGEADRARLESVGVDPERIRVTGTPILKNLPERKTTGDTVIFSPEHWDKEVPENMQVAEVLKGMSDVNVITKILDGEHDPLFYQNPVGSNRNKPDHLDIVKEVLATADVVVGISESTFELMAEAMDIPVVIADIWEPKACAGDERYKDYHREYSRACTRVKNVKKIPKAIRKALKKPHLLRKERQEVVVEDGGLHIKDPTKEITGVIKGLLNGQK